MSAPSRILERLAGHVQVSEGIGLPIYRLGRQIFTRFPPAAINFLVGRPGVARPTRFPVESGRFSPRGRRFLRPPTRPCTPPDLSGQPPITARFRPIFTPTATDFDPPEPASAPLSTGANGE
jgi:hypothetical protein